MKLDELTKLEAAMAPGPWRYCVGGIHSSEDRLVHGQDEYYPTALDSDDADGVIALRNAAPALIECASLLHRIVYGDTLLADIAKARAALARLEGTK